MTQQIRLFFTVPRPQAEEIYAKAEAAFEEEGWPLASFDDEDKGVFEISLYVSEGEEKEAQARLAAATGVEEAAVKHEILPQIDWVKHSLAGLQPVRAGRFFVHGAHDRDKIRQGETGIEIEANRAFGTGHHGTTAGCLEMLEKILAEENAQTVPDIGTGRFAPRKAASFPDKDAKQQDKPLPAAPQISLLDIGTGSGILAIAAAKLGKSRILATDNDPVAIEIANENIALNKVRDSITTACAEGFAGAEIAQAEPFDLIIANILAGPLISMAADMKKALKPGGSLLLSGILASQRDAVLAAYAAQGLRHIATLPKEGWVSLHLR